LSWVKEIFVVAEISDDIFDIPNEIPENLNVCPNLLFTDVKVSLMLASQMLNVFGTFVDVVVHAKVTGSYSVPSASRSAPSCLHTFSSAA
jgi:hypothetical protein